MQLIPTGFFRLSLNESLLVTLIAVFVGMALGPLIANRVNRWCIEPPLRRETRWTTFFAAVLFGIATFVIVALEGQRTPEVLPHEFWRFGRLVGHLVLLSLLITATATDLREYIIPDHITWLGTAIGIVLATSSGDTQLIHFWIDWNHPQAELLGAHVTVPQWIKDHPHLHGLAWSCAGAAVGAGITWLARAISSLVIGQESMGLGDVTLMAMIGSFLGWQPMLIVFFLAPFCGLFVGLAAKVIFNRSFLPYGPYLSFAALLVMLTWKWIWLWEPTRVVSIRKLFGDLPSLAILLGVSVVLLTVLMRIARWWRGDSLIHVKFPDSPSEP